MDSAAPRAPFVPLVLPPQRLRRAQASPQGRTPKPSPVSGFAVAEDRLPRGFGRSGLRPPRGSIRSSAPAGAGVPGAASRGGGPFLLIHFIEFSLSNNIHMFHEKSVFGRFPYLLPCLCISFFATLVFISCAWFPETLHKHKGLEREVEMVEGSITQESTEPPKKSLLKNWPLMSSIITYCVFSLHDTAYSEIFSLWTVSNRKYGGLSFSSKDVGQVLTAAGASLLVYQLFAYRWVNKTFGSIHSSRISSALSIPIIAAYPFMTHLSGIKLGAPLYTAAMLKSVFAITRVTGTSLLQNNAVPQEQRGAANGIATTAMSLSKAFAPAGAGIIFSWAQKRQHAAFFPGDHMLFLLLNLTEVIGLILTFKPFLAVPQQHK